MSPQPIRWPTTADETPGLFSAEELLVPELGTGRMSGLEFLHVTAKSILNHVPDGSRAPSNWTINVYRGCSHACSYCLTGDTPILMADGRTKPIADLRVGEKVVGTRSRAMVTTRVLDHWPTSRPAYRITLTDGRTIIGSADHRLLTEQGWQTLGALSPGADLLGCDYPDVVASEPHAATARARVMDVQDLGVELPMYDITTGTGDFVANGVVSHNCFARPTHDYLGLNIGDDFDRRIVVKINAVEKLRAELADPRWKRELVAMGTNTDPYQRAEAKYRLTRGVLQALVEHATPVSILTKSPLVTRDLDVLQNATAGVTVNFSIGTLDQQVWRASEPGTPNPRRRVAAMAQLSAAGICTGALVAPVLPGLSDSPRQLREVVTAIDDAGGRLLGIGALYLRPGVREHFLDWLRGAFPEQYDAYERRYATGAYAPAHYVDALYARAGVDRRSAPLRNALR